MGLQNKFIKLQEVPGRTNRLLSFDTTRTELTTTKLRGIHRQQGDLISILTKIRGAYTDRQMDGQTAK
jgi:hypothetical protein